MALGLLGACQQRGEPAVCLEKRQLARNAALQDELETASRLLEEVKAQCGPNSASDIQHISKLIANSTQAQLERARSEAAERELREKFPSRDFIRWATAKDGAVASKVSDVTCAERGSPDFGFCEASRPGIPGMSVRYWEAQKEAYRYSLVTRQPPTCEDLGEYRLVRAWSRHGASYERCELTNRRLRHLSALLVHGPEEHLMYVFSQDYLARDPSFEGTLRAIEPPAVSRPRL
jgi:hypothetical protein